MSKAKKTTETVFNCPFVPVIELIGGRWKSEICWHLQAGPRRFNEMRRLLVGITPKMLTQQLREMERDGLIERTQYNEIPPKVEYALTPIARSLDAVFGVIANWARTNLVAVGKARSTYDRKRARALAGAR